MAPKEDVVKGELILVDVREPGFPERFGKVARFHRTLKPGRESIERDDIQVARNVEQGSVEDETLKPFVIRAAQFFDPEVI